MNRGRRSRRNSSSDHPLPYCVRGPLLSRGERFFFLSLRRSLAAAFLVSFKVRLADLVTCGEEDWDAGFGYMIARHHLDFVLCDRETAEVLLAIELDDRSHEKPARKNRDRFINDALSAAGIPLLRVRAAATYDRDQLRSMIEQAITHRRVPPAS